MTNKFQFFEYVTLNSNDSDLAEINGRTGPIMSMGQYDDGVWRYGVRFEGIDERCSVPESDLVSTGKIGKREDFYPGDTLRVRSDGSVVQDDQK